MLGYRWDGEGEERGVETRVIGVCNRDGAATRCGALSGSGDADDIGERTRWPARGGPQEVARWCSEWAEGEASLFSKPLFAESCLKEQANFVQASFSQKTQSLLASNLPANEPCLAGSCMKGHKTPCGQTPVSQ